MRPCGNCNRLPPDGAPYSPEFCRFCWNYHHDPEWRTFFDERAPQLPSLGRRAGNFAGAVIQHVASGLRIASAETQAARLALCQTCELLTAARKCAHAKCGCPVDKKVRWQSQRCPLDKW